MYNFTERKEYINENDYFIKSKPTWKCIEDIKSKLIFSIY